MMKVSGFSIIRNAIQYDYPVVEAISSVLPLCDEFIINVGTSDDDTLNLIRSISSSKLRIIERTWDMTLRSGGKLLSIETNNALKECTGDWCFYIQADEVLHEKYLPVVRDAMTIHLSDVSIEGLQFRYKHFYGSYDYYQDNFRNWYVKETRVIRRHENIVSWGDGMDFRHRDGSSLSVKKIKVEIYHYGWVRTPQIMVKKNIALNTLYHTDNEIQNKMKTIQRPYDELGHLRRFNETHPKVMHERIAISNFDFDAKIELQLADWIRHFMLFFLPLTKRIRRWMGI